MLYPRGTSSKVLIVVASLAALAAFFYWRRHETPLATTDPAVAPSPRSSPSSPSPSPRPSSALPSPTGEPAAGAAATGPPARQYPEAPPETAEVLDRLSTTLMSLVKPCGASLRSADDPAQQLRFRIDAAGDQIQHLSRVEGELPPGVAECIEQQWHAARFAPVDGTLSLQLVVAVRDLR